MNMKNWKSSTLVTIAASGLLFSCSKATSPAVHAQASAADLKPVKTRKAAPDFTLKDSNGSSVKLSNYKGKVVLLNFWATWCGPCQIEVPWFVDFQQQYKAQGLEVLGVSMDEDGWAAVKPWITQKKVNYRILLADDSTAQLYGGVDALPTSFLIDRDGKIAAVHVGLAGKDEYSNEIQNLLGTAGSITNGQQGSRAALRSNVGRVMPAILITSAAR